MCHAAAPNLPDELGARNRDVNDPEQGAGSLSRARPGVVHVSVPFLHRRNRRLRAA